MKLSETTTSDVTVEQAFSAHTEQSVREQACKESGALSWEVTIAPVGDVTRIQVDRVMPPAVPDFVKKFLGETISVRQVEEWSAPASDGGRTATVKVTIQGQPASMVGTAVLKPQGTGSVEIVEGDVKVAVPFLGKKIEPEIVKVIAAALKIEQRVGVEWIKSQ
ncbi:DUF2505 domain-containing protein [Jatrophihabitans telluris]|uniref:DUF2505 domain-containing protein n=1 Tax=Jatrophihabitans telluris TaxID=2038343 RepID=A0ABY4R074_9ACTN|nr:DUF2505 domain-containing protein [Jatrophihabitans telluris]UQX89110.1 DUF2505 domain-containing protein [Jatrophihabitans telluris]